MVHQTSLLNCFYVIAPELQTMEGICLIDTGHLFATGLLKYKSELEKPIDAQTEEWGVITRGEGWSSRSEGHSFINEAAGHGTGLAHPGKIPPNP